MKKIVIAHLYYDLLNLYGESGNISVLKYHLNSLNVETTIIKLTVTDSLDFSDYDLVYIGSGTNDNLALVAKHLIVYKESFRHYIENGGFVLATGNAMSLFGEYDDIDSLKLFDYVAINTKKYADELVLDADFLENKLIAFKNTSLAFSIKNPLFSNNEGFKYNNFYAMNILGPVLYRNPELLNYFINKLLDSTQNLSIDIDNIAYNNYMNWKNKE